MAQNKPRGKPFEKGDDPRRGPKFGEERGEMQPETIAVVTDGLSGDTGVLATMRHVLDRPKEDDVTQRHREFRGWLKDDRKGFMNKLVDEEAKGRDRKIAELEAKVKQMGGRDTNGEWGPTRKCRNCWFADNELDENGDPPIDEGTKRAMAVNSNDRLEAEIAKEDADIAARPDAAQIGAARRAELCAAIAHERKMHKTLHELRHDATWDRMFAVFYAEQTMQAMELADEPNPSEHAARLRRELEGSRERGRILMGMVERMDRSGAA
jgi:hypothetical protein